MKISQLNANDRERPWIKLDEIYPGLKPEGRSLVELKSSNKKPDLFLSFSWHGIKNEKIGFY